VREETPAGTVALVQRLPPSSVKMIDAYPLTPSPTATHIVDRGAQDTALTFSRGEYVAVCTQDGTVVDAESAKGD
jgi:hypothetical protein